MSQIFKTDCEPRLPPGLLHGRRRVLLVVQQGLRRRPETNLLLFNFLSVDLYLFRTVIHYRMYSIQVFQVIVCVAAAIKDKRRNLQYISTVPEQLTFTICELETGFYLFHMVKNRDFPTAKKTPWIRIGKGGMGCLSEGRRNT